MFVGLIAVLYPVQCAQPLNVLTEKIVVGLSVELNAGFSNDQTRVDFAFKDKADYSWRPDRYRFGTEANEQTDIRGFKTDPTSLVLSIAGQIDTILNAAENAVTEMKLTLKNQVGNYNWTMDQNGKNKT